MENRIWEIDALRGIAIIMMVIFHFLFDLNFLGIVKINVYEGFLLLFQRTTASIFLLVFGMLIAIRKPVFSNSLNRFFKLGAIAILITAATWIYPNDGFIVFGIIHFLAFSCILGYFFRNSKYVILYGLLVIVIGLMIDTIRISSPLLLWLGILPYDFYSLDYFPVFPWFGIVLIGIGCGNLLYRIPKSLFGNARFAILQFLANHSLLIYLIHQPILIGVLLLYKAYLV